MIVARDLSHRFRDGKLALDRVDLSINEGELVVIAGRNGSGKTVLAKHFNGLLTPTSGEILFESKPVHKNLLHVRQRVGIVFQNPDSQIVGQTVEEDIAFGPRNLRLSNDEIARRVDEALESTGLSGSRDARPYNLSGGEKRRLAIASVLAMKPSLLVLDEPFSNLDYPAVRQVLGRIVRLHAEGITIVLITHELEKTLAHATRLVVMENGAIRCDGEPAAVLDRVEEFGIRKPRVSARGIAELTWLG